MPKKILTAILFFTAVSYSLAQQSDIRKLREELDRAENDTQKLVHLSNIARYYAESNPDSANIFGERQLAIARRLNFKIEEVMALREIGYAQMNMGNYSRSLQLLLSAIAICEDPKIEKKALTGNYRVYDFINRSKDANNQRLQGLAFTQQALGILYANANNYEKAIFYHYEGLKSARACESIPLQIVLNLTLGRMYLSVGKADSALIIEQQAYDQAMQIGFFKYMGSILLNLGRIQSARGDKQRAIEYFHKSVEISTEHGYFRGIVAASLLLNDFYKNSLNKDTSFQFIQKALSAAEYVQAPDMLLRSYRALADYYKAINNIDSIAKYQALVIKINDNLSNSKQLQQFQNIDFDERQRQQQIEAANAAYKVKLRTYTLLAGLAIILCAAIMLWRNSHQRKLANKTLSKQKRELESTLETLRTTQKQLIQSEKMASLGELTAGIAHEIQNPLNFVNNFSEVNAELLQELKDGPLKNLPGTDKEQVNEILDTLGDNLEKISHHGQRADAIVKGMLQHSRTGSGQKETTDVNELCEEYLRLSYHGMRAKNKDFNAVLQTDFDKNIGKISIIPQDFGRAMLNLYNNAFYSMAEKAKVNLDGYEPTISVITNKMDGKLLITVKDNGTGMPDRIKEKIFQPFFTTRPAGQGTGLGLSLSYDIITKEHGGEIKVESTEGEGAEFIITLPV